ncbi:hypothetical protein V1478_017289 [Vespula squamosa]|uniref:Uncharacterized protein n=1 Tax=Vespula squamosa TaxID=30214 RepID=A0ABD1ZXK0_VESSQ
MQEATRNRERRGQFPNDSDLSPLVCSGKPVKFATLRSHLEIQIYRETGKPVAISNEVVPTKFLDGIMRNFTLGFYMCILHEIRISKLDQLIIRPMERSICLKRQRGLILTIKT